MPPIGFKHKFHDNKKVANSPLRGPEHRSLDWWPAVLVTIQLIYVSLLILLCADIQLPVLKWPWTHFTSLRLYKKRFFSHPTTITSSSKYPQWHKNQSSSAELTITHHPIRGRSVGKLTTLWITLGLHQRFTSFNYTRNTKE